MAHADVISVILDILAVVTTALHDASLLEGDALNALLERTIRDGLPNKLLPNVSYDVGYAQFINAAAFRAADRAACRPLTSASITPHDHGELAWEAGPGPTYSAAQAKTVDAKRCAPVVNRVTSASPRVSAWDP